VDQTVQERVGDGGVPDEIVPLRDRVLAGQQRGAAADPVIDHFKQVAVLLALGCGQAEVIDDEKIQASQTLEEAGQAAVGMGRLQRTKQLARMKILRAEAVAAGLVPERTRQVTFSIPVGPVIMQLRCSLIHAEARNCSIWARLRPRA